jgi:outer membrane protein TolC
MDDEDFFGTGDLAGLSASVLNTLITQVIERGGKRQARTEAARRAGEVMDAEYAMRRRDVITQTGQLYFQAVAAREDVLFQEAALARSKETARLVTSLLEAGRVTIGSAQQARLEVQKSELALNLARKASEQASQALSAQWGDFRTTAVNDLRLGPPPALLPPRHDQESGLASHPNLLLSQARVAESDALVTLAKANKLNNITLGGGVRHASASDELSGLVSFSIPIPVFNKQEDAIKERFYSDCSDEDVNFAKPLLVPESSSPFMTPVSVTDENFGRVPRVYISCLRDRAISPTIQKQMCSKLPCQIIEIESDHAPFFQHQKS